jgi:Ca2+-binding EF-hand superfamily protein
MNMLTTSTHRLIHWLVVVTLAIFFFGGVQTARAQMQLDRAKTFDFKDLDRNKTLDKEEFSGGSIGKVRERSDVEFDRKDTDGDQKLTLEEFLKQAVVSAEVREQEAQEQHRLEFERQDTDEDGLITKSQFLGSSEGQARIYAEDFFNAIDKDTDGSLDEDEFVIRPNLWDVPRIQFQWRDANRDGNLTMDEFIAAELGQAWEKDRRQLFSQFDANADKKLNIDEFVALEAPELRNRQISKLPKEQQKLARYDTDQDGAVSLNELAKVAPVRNEASAKLLFGLLDKNADATISNEEINLLGGADGKINFAFRDLDGNGHITLSEQISESKGKSWEKGDRQFFEDRDFNLDNRLSPDEFAMNENDPRMMFRRRDLDKNGEISLDEELKYHGAVGKSWEGAKREDFRVFDLDRNGGLSREEFVLDKNDLRIVFARRDKDNSGDLTIDEELIASYAKGKTWEADVRKMILSFDQNEDNILSVEEFGRLEAQRSRDRKVDAMQKEQQRLARYDLDESGSVSLIEFTKGQPTRSESSTKQLFATLDRNKDSVLNEEEVNLLDGKDLMIKFAIRDMDGDGVLTFMEQMDGSIGKEWEKGERQFFEDRDFDLDGRLTRDEFAMKGDDPRMLFRQRDLDKNDAISLDEELKYHGAVGKPWEGAKREDFRVFDLDRSGGLSREEFLLDKNDLRVVFARRDKDNSGDLSIDEELNASYAKGKSWEADVRKMILSFDENDDNMLSVEEFGRLETQRIRTRKIEAMPKEQQRLARYDLDENGTVDLPEFAKGQSTRSEASTKNLFTILDRDKDLVLGQDEINLLDGTDLSITFALHDADSNGKLTLEEELKGRNALGADWEKWARLDFYSLDIDRDGVLELEEFQLDRKDPRVSHSRHDTDRDGKVSLKEYLGDNLGKAGEAWNTLVFRGQDADRDEVLTVEELKLSETDVGVKFRRLDVSNDGLVSAEEFLVYDLGKSWEAHHRRRFQIHDSDKSGDLSFVEYKATDAEAMEERRVSSFAPEERAFAKLDQSHDSKLTFQEFTRRKDPSQLIEAHERQLFQALDFDHDDVLIVNEFLSMGESVPQILFANYDINGDGQLSVDEYKRSLPPQRLAAGEGAFDDYDLDHNSSLSSDEFVQWELGRTGRERWAWVTGWFTEPMSLLTGLMIAIDVALVFVVGRICIGRLTRRRATMDAARSTGEA